MLIEICKIFYFFVVANQRGFRQRQAIIDCLRKSDIKIEHKRERENQ